MEVRAGPLCDREAGVTEKVIRFADWERKSRNPDAMQPRDPCEATVIILPVIRIERPLSPFAQAQQEYLKQLSY
jgi:hypothetical protein